ncbi:hypothetical protein QYM36_014056 [Artemia franciscana]|uniref:t-SNARE coiled-coil homology domain-containing protein n=1 Tax=Artemia franciscana TaxID=6661 RepID=A0AA88HMK2_ARTSF|nr:hypothetical protein QYM36_014056 [Artemia franciscana]
MLFLKKKYEIVDIVRKVAHDEGDNLDPKLVSKVAKCTSEPRALSRVMTYVWNKLLRSNKWCHIKKLLLLLESLVKEENKEILEDCKSHFGAIAAVGKKWRKKKHGKHIVDLVGQLMCCILDATESTILIEHTLEYFLSQHLSDAVIENILRYVNILIKEINEFDLFVKTKFDKEEVLDEDIKVIETKSKIIEKKIREFANIEANNIASRIQKFQHSAIEESFQKVMFNYSTCLNSITCLKENLNLLSPDITKVMEVGKCELTDTVDIHKKTMNLECSIKQLSSMQEDISFLVQQQGDLVDNIESNMDQTEDYVQRGADRTKQASKFQRKYRKKLIFGGICSLNLISILTVTLILLI